MKIEKLSVWELVQPFRHFTESQSNQHQWNDPSKRNNQLVSLLQRFLWIKLYLQPLFDAQNILFFTANFETVSIDFRINRFFELSLLCSSFNKLNRPVLFSFENKVFPNSLNL